MLSSWKFVERGVVCSNELGSGYPSGDEYLLVGFLIIVCARITIRTSEWNLVVPVSGIS